MFFGKAQLVTDRCLSVVSSEGEKTDELDEVAGILTEIASEIPFTPPDIEEDFPGECVPHSSLWQPEEIKPRNPVVTCQNLLFYVSCVDTSE